jgi:hypothetical protein
MGHVRLGNLPKTRNWIQVIDLLEQGAATDQIASATLSAAEKGFLRASYDAGFRHTIWLLTQITLAAREKNFGQQLKKLGLNVSNKPGIFEIVGAFSKHLDNYLNQRKARSDISEMAQFAAVESLSENTMRRSKTLFETSSDDVQRAIKEMSTKANFARFAKDFFSRFTYRYLSYFISRESSKHVGPGGPIDTIEAHTQFRDALETHCRQSAVIVEDFAGGWYSKTNYESGITPEKAAGFGHVALKKLASELRRGEMIL